MFFNKKKITPKGRPKLHKSKEIEKHYVQNSQITGELFKKLSK